MQTQLAPAYKDTPLGQAAEDILRKCVHCGFCTATCPTYQVLGDELDGPRGRIYLMKQAFEGVVPTRSTQQHLDRCLTCRNCESTCPSGVEYGKLLDLGRHVVDAQVRRPLRERLMRWALRTGLNSAAFAPAIRLGQSVRTWLPTALRNKVPPLAQKRTLSPNSAALTAVAVRKKVLMPIGCVQPALMPNIDAATQRVLAAAGIQTIATRDALRGAGCCGAIAHHLGDTPKALRHIKTNIDAWWPLVQSGETSAIVLNASGCAVMAKDWAHLLSMDTESAHYMEKAQRISSLCRDLSELLPDWLENLPPAAKQRISHNAKTLGAVAYHPPCTLQHGQKLKGSVEQHLRSLGVNIQTSANESHLCCGSAGTYSVLQPQLATTLRDRKLAALPQETSCIASANVGCIGHLQSGTAKPVQHWVELLDDLLSA